MSLRAGLALGLAALLAPACRAPDPRAELEVADLEAYFVLDAPRGDTQYLAPAVRFRVRNKGAKPARSIQANAVFRRAGEEDKAWSGDWLQVVQANKPLAPGAATPILLMKPRDEGRYYSTGAPETMFEHRLFRDVKVDVFLRLGSSPWTKMAEAKVERRIGARSVQESR
jgi:hypothetical protein